MIFSKRNLKYNEKLDFLLVMLFLFVFQTPEPLSIIVYKFIKKTLQWKQRGKSF